MKQRSVETGGNRTPNSRMGLASKRKDDSSGAGGEGAVNCGGGTPESSLAPSLHVPKPG